MKAQIWNDWDKVEKTEAGNAAVRAKEEATEAKAELERYKRQKWLEDRESNPEDREGQFQDEHNRLPGPPRLHPREVVISQPRAPVRFVDEAEDAMRRARDDEKQRSGRGRAGGRY